MLCEMLQVYFQYLKEEAIVIVNLTDKEVETPNWLNEYASWSILLESKETINKTLKPYAYKILKKDD